MKEFKGVQSRIKPEELVRTATMVDKNYNIRMETVMLDQGEEQEKVDMWVYDTTRFETLGEYTDYTIAELDARGRSVENISAIAFVTLCTSSQIDDVTASENAGLFVVWSEDWRGKAGDIACYDGVLYRSIHDVNDAGQNTKPPETPSMWTKMGKPGEEYPEWSQPIGGHDAYPIGAKVTYKGKRYESSVDNNVWQPGVFGWEEVM